MSELSSAIKVTAFGATDVGRARTSNEDAFLIASLGKDGETSTFPGEFDVSNHAVLLAVADGVGGQKAGEVASRLTLDSLRESLVLESARSCPTDALKVCIERAHEDVKRAASESDQRGGMGSTVVAAVLAGSAAYVSNVGDSRLYLCRDGTLEQVTKDHTLYQHAIDRGASLLDEASAQHVLLQAIGQPRPLDIRVDRICIDPGDLLLLCSDGLTGAVSDQELERVLTGSAGLDVMCTELIALANARGGHDNITVVVARVQVA